MATLPSVVDGGGLVVMRVVVTVELLVVGSVVEYSGKILCDVEISEKKAMNI